MVEYEELYEEIKEILSEKRFKHTLGVVERAIEYAKIYNVSVEDTKIAAILHDVAKEIPKEESYKMLEEYGVELDEIENKNFNLIHSKLGAIIAKNKYGLPDEIANAIQYHTTGKPNMTMLEKVIYLADATEPGRKYDDKLNQLSLDELVKMIRNNIDDGMRYVLRWTIESLIKRNLYIHLNSIEAYNYYLEARD